RCATRLVRRAIVARAGDLDDPAVQALAERIRRGDALRSSGLGLEVVPITGRRAPDDPLLRGPDLVGDDLGEAARELSALSVDRVTNQGVDRPRLQREAPILGLDDTEITERGRRDAGSVLALAE